MPKLFIRRRWRRRVRPLQALAAMRTLLRDPDDTRQVFRIINALAGDSLTPLVRKMRGTAEGRVLLSRRPQIVPVLNDREALLALPEGSIGRAYYDFVHREHLSADGLVAASEVAEPDPDLDPEALWLGERQRDIHDLQHVLTGYGRDPIGELCLLSFMTHQSPNRGIDFIIFMGQRKYQQLLPELDVRALVEEGKSIALAAAWMPKVAWEDRLHEPLDAVRHELGFAPPEKYFDYLGGPAVATTPGAQFA
jgi:ubiquinone biosynthesis protein COQ4